MKLRKMMVFVVSLALIIAVSAPVYAADVNLPVPLPTINSDTQQGWATDGVDGVASSLTADDFHAAKYLVLEFGTPPAGGMQVIWQGDGDGWAWTQTDGIVSDDGSDETTLVIELATTLKNYDKFLESEEIKIFIAHYSPDIAALNIKNVYFTDKAPGAAPPAAAPVSAGDNPATGEGYGIYIAIAVVLLAAAGIIVFSPVRRRQR